MTGEEKINIKIKKDMGITQALKKLVKDAGESVKGSVWNATLEKLVELNNKRKADKQNSIFSGGTECNDWHHNYVVHEGEIEFSKSEMEVLLDAMEVSEGVKSKILGNVPEVVDPPEVAEPPAGGGGVEPPVEGAVKTPAEIEQVAKEKGYRKTDHEGTYFDDKTQTHYRWDDETGDFKALENVKQIYADGTYRGKDNKFYGADDNPFTGERVTKNEDETVITTETYKDGVYDGKSVVTINEDKSYKKETYDKDNKLIKTENYNAEGKLTSSVVGNRTTTVEYTDNGSVWTEKEGKNVMKVTKRDSDGRTIEVAEGNAVLTYSYNEDGSYTVTKKVDGKLNQITDYNSEGLEVRWQKYNEEEVLDRESKYTYRQDGTRIADIEYYNVTLERDLISEQVIELKLKQDDAWYMVSHIAKQKDGKYNVNVDMNMYLGSTVVGDQCIVYIETEEEAKALQEELLGLRELYSEIAYYDKDGVQRAEPEISDERKTEIITKLTETISDKDKPLEVRQAAAFAATYGCLMDDETLQNAIIDTNDAGIINRLEGTDLQPEQWEKIYNMALKPEFKEKLAAISAKLSGTKIAYGITLPLNFF